MSSRSLRRMSRFMSSIATRSRGLSSTLITHWENGSDIPCIVRWNADVEIHLMDTLPPKGSANSDIHRDVAMSLRRFANVANRNQARNTTKQTVAIRLVV